MAAITSENVLATDDAAPWWRQLINVPFNFGGTSLLIVVGVALDTIQQMNQHLLLRKYDGFMKKGRVRFRGRQGAPGGF